MSPSVDLTPQTFARLQAHAVPLVDSIESVINRIIDHYEAKSGTPFKSGTPAHTTNGGEPEQVREFSPTAPPDLTHTKILSIDFNGKSLDYNQATWNGLLLVAIREAKNRAKSPADFKRSIIVKFVEHPKNDEGYRYLSDVGISVQGQDANASWRAACHIAQQIGCQVRVTFVWRQKEGAAFPGVTGRLSVAVR